MQGDVAVGCLGDAGACSFEALDVCSVCKYARVIVRKL